MFYLSFSNTDYTRPNDVSNPFPKYEPVLRNRPGRYRRKTPRVINLVRQPEHGTDRLQKRRTSVPACSRTGNICFPGALPPRTPALQNRVQTKTGTGWNPCATDKKRKIYVRFRAPNVREGLQSILRLVDHGQEEMNRSPFVALRTLARPLQTKRFSRLSRLSRFSRCGPQSPNHSITSSPNYF
jgi:hypothetical protein